MRTFIVFMAFCLLLMPTASIGSAQTTIDFGKVLRGSQKTITYQIKSGGDVTISSDRLWIQLDKTAIKAPGSIKITVKASLLPKGTTHTGTVSVKSKSRTIETCVIKVSTENTIELKLKIGSKTATLNNRILQVKTPMRMKGCTPLIPLRFVCDVLGATTLYNPKDTSISIFRLDRVIEILPDVEEFEVNGKSHVSNPAPAFYNGVMFVPLGLISTSFGVCIEWDRTGENGTIKLCD